MLKIINTIKNLSLFINHILINFMYFKLPIFFSWQILLFGIYKKEKKSIKNYFLIYDYHKKYEKKIIVIKINYKFM